MTLQYATFRAQNSKPHKNVCTVNKKYSGKRAMYLGTRTVCKTTVITQEQQPCRFLRRTYFVQSSCCSSNSRCLFSVHHRMPPLTPQQREVCSHDEKCCILNFVTVHKKGFSSISEVKCTILLLSVDKPEFIYLYTSQVYHSIYFYSSNSRID